MRLGEESLAPFCPQDKYCRLWDAPAVCEAELARARAECSLPAERGAPGSALPAPAGGAEPLLTCQPSAGVPSRPGALAARAPLGALFLTARMKRQLVGRGGIWHPSRGSRVSGDASCLSPFPEASVAFSPACPWGLGRYQDVWCPVRFWWKPLDSLIVFKQVTGFFALRGAFINLRDSPPASFSLKPPAEMLVSCPRYYDNRNNH